MIELACITDRAFVRHTGAMLHSALSACAPTPCRIHLLHSTTLAQIDVARLEQLAAKYSAMLQLLPIDEATIADLPDGYFPRTIWLRILLPHLLPDTAKVLYLDSDLIVDADLTPLWDTDVSSHLLAAVTNPFYPFMPPHPRVALGIGDPRDYFNSGVLLMNLQRMRAEGTTTQLRDYALRHPDASYPDQDALNAVCRDRWRHLHPRWNAQSTVFELAEHELPLPASEVAEARAQPAVVHFIGPFKPWHYLCRHPLRNRYFDHARATPWGAPEVEGRTLRTIILRLLPLAWIDRWFRAERRAAALWRRVRMQLSLTPA